MSRTRQPSTRRIGAAQRAIAVLDTLAEAGELGTNEIARRTGMTPSTVSRQLGTLAASGLVERVAASGRYRLGLRIVHLANALLARLDVREVARPHLVALVEATGETATLSVPGDEDAITVDFVPGSHHVQPVSKLGRPSVGHATSAGKVMLAFSGQSFVTSRRCAPTRPERSRIRRRLHGRSRKCASAGGRRQLASASRRDLAAIAAPVRSSRGELEAMIALQGPRLSLRRAGDGSSGAASRRAGRRDLERARLARALTRIDSAAVSSTASKSDIDVLMDLNRDYISSVQNGDVRRFDEILADDFLCSNPDGSLVGRAAFFEQTAKPVTISNLEAHDVNVRIIGDVAIIHARTTYDLADGRAGSARYTDVWARRGGRWLAISAHVTRG